MATPNRPTGGGKRGGFFSESGVDPRYGLRALYDRVYDAKEEFLDAAAIALVRQTKVELSTPGRGRVYLKPRFHRDGRRMRTKRGALMFIKHRASAPGDPPAVDTGNLRGSITFERVTKPLGANVTGGAPRITTARRVGTNVEYGPYLEFGTPRVAARPFLEPAVRKVSVALGRQLRGRLMRVAK